MFKRRDIPPVLLLLLLIILVMLTLSQILVVHNGRYGRNVHNMRKLQLELREMDINLHSLMLQNVPSIELNRRLLQNEINAGRFASIIHQAEAGRRPAPSRRRAARRPHRARTSTSSSSEVANRTNSAAERQQGLLEVPQSFNTSSLSSPLASSRGSVQTSVNSWTHEMTGNLTSIANITHNNFNNNRTSGSPGGGRGSPPSPPPPPDHPSLPPDRTSPPPAHISDLLAARQRLHQRLSGDGVLQPRASRNVIKYCPSIPPSLVGRVDVLVDIDHAPSVDDVIQDNPRLMPGGCWKPANCTARHRVAVIIPYRDREEHLMILLRHLHPMLQKQQLDYRIVVVEQYGSDTFNKARIMNIAFVEVLKRHNFHCFVFHDVDLVPEDDRNMYSCPAQPRHMSVAIDEMGYKLAYQELVGGVLNMRTEHFQRVNGYSNLYWGWGAEDDDMAYRIMHVGLKITRPPDGVARYKMVKHTKRKPADWRKRAKLLYTGTRRFQFDGLNSLQYKLIHMEDRPLFTHILVDIGKPPRGF